MKTTLLALFALIAFAGNSVLCRLALTTNAGYQTIDPTSFTSIRLFSGVVMLFILLNSIGRVQNTQAEALNTAVTGNLNTTVVDNKGSWLAGMSLFLYAALFSFAYVTLDTATGALILFGSVQITMISVGWLRGDRLSLIESIGVCLALIGFVYLFLPELRQPSLFGLVMMVLAGVAWGDYTLRGKGSNSPLSTSAYNFLRTLPLVAVLLAAFVLARMIFDVGQAFNVTQTGLLLAIASGAITSGIGYAVWYAALKGLSTTQAAVIQLLVPVIAAVGGVIFADETISLRLIIAGALVLGGVLIVIVGRATGESS